jgi:farnesyl-diphosphate farnesyltransferase
VGDDRAFCEAMLPKVSRTFALCIRLLPDDLEYPVLIAYLLCRIADTVEDTADLTGQEKQDLLCEFAASLDDPTIDLERLRSFFDRREMDEEELAAGADAVLREFRLLRPEYRDRIRPWVQEMCEGMGQFAHTTSLRTVSDLERYCYYVAGTVGHMLTDLYPIGRPAINGEKQRRLKALATSFGLGLQLTNIIKDVGDDGKRGWIFIPEQLCHEAGISPADLHDASVRSAAQSVMYRLIDKAEGHLRDALEYCTNIPRRQYGIRLFCLTSLFFAVRTLRLARHDDRLLEPSHKIKISRRQVYWTVGLTRCLAPSNGLLRTYYRHLSRA